MGLYDNIIVGEGVELPDFDGESQDIGWQTKSLTYPSMETYKITDEGRLHIKKRSMRKKTDEELEQEAKEQGFDSWREWEESDAFGPLPDWEKTVDEEWWEDVDQHGSFSFYTDWEDDRSKWWYSYEARFTEGWLDGIILLKRNLLQIKLKI